MTYDDWKAAPPDSSGPADRCDGCRQMFADDELTRWDERWPDLQTNQNVLTFVWLCRTCTVERERREGIG